MWEYLPNALWDEILIGLPHTTLVHFSSVCKAFRSVIVRPSFLLRYSLSNPTPPPFLLIQTLSSQSQSQSQSQWSLFTTPPFPSPLIANLDSPYPSSFRFLDSFHGIVFLIDHDRDIVLWNPSVRRHLTLQIPTPQHLAIGFGFDSKNHDFKLIRLFHPGRVEIYSLNDRAWRVIYSPFCKELGVGQFAIADTSCFLNGNVYWIVATPHPRKSNRFLIFNVVEEKFNIMELPPELVYVSLFTMKLTVIDGCLSVLLYNRLQCMPSVDYSCDVWTMREYGVVESWTKILFLNFKGRPVFGLSTSGKVLVPQVNRAGRGFGSLLSFDTESQEMTVLKIQGSVITACECTQSLVLLDGKRDGVFCPVNKRIKHDTDYYSCPKVSRTSTRTHPRGGSPRLI